MQGIADKIRHFRTTFHAPVTYAWRSSALWLSVLLAGLILGLLYTDLYLRFSESYELLGLKDQALLLIFELPMVFGMLQVHFLGAERRYRWFHPNMKRISLRTPQASLNLEMRAHIRAAFNRDDLHKLAKYLIEEWEWRRVIKRQAQDLLWIRALGFFSLPCASNFAAYTTGFVAVLAGIVLATMTPDAVFGDFARFLQDSWSLVGLLWLIFVLPFAVCVLPGAVMLNLLKDLGVLLVESWTTSTSVTPGFIVSFLSSLSCTTRLSRCCSAKPVPGYTGQCAWV